MQLLSEKEKLASHVARLDGLDSNRSRRIYKVLSDLSVKAIGALENNDAKLFSIQTDKMRPLMSYITNNTVKLSNHLDNETLDQKIDIDTPKKDLQEFIPVLTQNLKIIDEARKAISVVPFSPSVFSSREISNAYLDYFLPLVWDFEFDVIILLNLDDTNFLDYLIERGQKRFFIIGSSIDNIEIVEKIEKYQVSISGYEDASVIRDLFLAIQGKPPAKFTVIDCGTKKFDVKTINKMIEEAEQGRNANWHRFNTVNRADEVRVLDNLHNLVSHEQTSKFHNKFKGIPGVIVCPGPSLQKNIKALKDIKGKAVIVCVLRALGTLLKNGIEPDIVLQIDPHNLREMPVRSSKKVSNLWTEWIEKNDMSKVKLFITSLYSHQENFNIPAEQVMWMSPFQIASGSLPFEIFEYKRPGGSVAHSALDLLIEFGCSCVALVGQDLAYSNNNEVYTKSAETETNEESKKTKFGYDFNADGINGSPVRTNNVFVNFARLFTHFAKELETSEIKLYNCSQMGLRIDGFQHCSLDTFVKNECNKFVGREICEILSEKKITTQMGNSEENNIKMNKFISRNLVLANEISRLTSNLKIMLRKEKLSEVELSKFDKLQNKVIKKMKRNYFYTLALQKDSYILQAGLKADSAVATQLEFHKDFLISIDHVNEKFKTSLMIQRKKFQGRESNHREVNKEHRLAG